MCEVIINNSIKDEKFIIYNHIFSKERYTFTILQLLQELRQYNLILTEAAIEDEVNEFVRSGLIHQYYDCYAVCEK